MVTSQAGLQGIWIIAIVIFISVRLLMAVWFSFKLSDIEEAKGGTAKILVISFIMILLYGILGMIASALMCNAIPDKNR